MPSSSRSGRLAGRRPRPAPVARLRPARPRRRRAPRRPPSATRPVDFSEQAKALYRLVACTGDAPAPPGWTQRPSRRYCARQAKSIEAARKHAAEAGAFIGRSRPADLPTTVVYPFGGGDLLTALTVYPEARDVTTLSLEHAGDPRRLPDRSTRRRRSPRAWS